MTPDACTALAERLRRRGVNFRTTEWESFMVELFNVYCDESCHLENDGYKAMTLGVVWCPTAQVRPVAERINFTVRV